MVSHLKGHIETHNLNKSIKCPEPDCNKLFKTTNSLRGHRKQFHSEFYKFACNDCGKKFCRTDQYQVYNFRFN